MTAAVWTRLSLSGGKLMLALALADHANPDGTSIFPAVSTLAWYTRQDVRTVQRQLRELIKLGWLELVRKRRPGFLTREYRISADWVRGDTLPGIPDRPPKPEASPMPLSPAMDARMGDTAMPPNSSRPSNTHRSSLDDSGEEGAARRRVHATINGLSASKRLKP